MTVTTGTTGVGTCMHALITFNKGNRVLTSFPYPVEKPDDYVKAIEAAYAQFKKDHPKVNLFDGVHVMFDHVDMAATGESSVNVDQT